MKSERTIRREVKALKAQEGRRELVTTHAFMQGTIDALLWVLGDFAPPTSMLTFVREVQKKARTR